jgi:hypothetical protein
VFSLHKSATQVKLNRIPLPVTKYFFFSFSFTVILILIWDAVIVELLMANRLAVKATADVAPADAIE